MGVQRRHVDGLVEDGQVVGAACEVAATPVAGADDVVAWDDAAAQRAGAWVDEQ